MKVVVDLFRLKRQRNSQSNRQPIGDSGHQNANYGVGLSVQSDRLSDEVEIRTKPVPQTMRQNNFVVLPEFPLLGQEVAAHQEVKPLHLEPARGSEVAENFFGMVGSRKVELFFTPGIQVLKN